jgi:hypothetical protein
MMSESRHVVVWVAGIIGAVISAVLAAWLTGVLHLSPTPQSGPGPTVDPPSVPRTQTLSGLRIVDQLNPGWTSAEVQITIDGEWVGTLTTDTSRTADSVIVKDLAPGTYSYELRITGYARDELDEPAPVDGYGTGTMRLTGATSYAIRKSNPEGGSVELKLCACVRD